mgnify:CR=1 FL=1
MKGIIFDFDGVIFDSEVIYLESLLQYLESIGIHSTTKDVQYLIGMKMQEICVALQKQFDLYDHSLDELRFGQYEYFDRLMESADIQAMPGLAEFLKRCKDKEMTIAVASSSGEDYIVDLLNRFNVANYFDYIVSGNCVEHGKPEPDIFLYALNKMGLNKEDVMIIEDSVNGIKAGVASGMYTIGFKGSKIIQDTSQADIEVHAFSEIAL